MSVSVYEARHDYFVAEVNITWCDVKIGLIMGICADNGAGGQVDSEREVVDETGGDGVKGQRGVDVKVFGIHGVMRIDLVVVTVWSKEEGHWE